MSIEVFHFVFSQKDYVCFDFARQHHNVIRYRKGIAVIKDDFHTVCSWVQFDNKEKWKYDLYLKKHPVPIQCPVAGKFNFTQRGDVLFETRFENGGTCWILILIILHAQNFRRYYRQSSSKHILQTEHIRLFILWRAERNCHWRKLLSFSRLSWQTNWYLQWSRLQDAMHRILEGKSEILSYHIRWVGSVLKIQVLGVSESWSE